MKYKPLDPIRFLEKLNTIGIELDFIGGRSEEAQFSVLDKLNEFTYNIYTNHKNTISCFSGSKFWKTIETIEDELKVSLFK